VIVRAIALLAALLSVAPALAGFTDIFWVSDPEALAFGGSNAPPPVTDTPRVDYPTSLPRCADGRFSVDAVSQAPLDLRREGRTIARLDTHATNLRLATPVNPDSDGAGWFVGWRSSVVDTSGHHRDTGEDTILDCRVTDRAVGLARVGDGGWTFGASASDYEMRLTAAGASVDDFQGMRPGEGGAALDLDSTSLVLAVEREYGHSRFGLQHSRRPVDALLPLQVNGDDYIGAYDGTLVRWDAWATRDYGSRRWFAWAAISSVDSGSDPLGGGGSVRGHLHTDFDARTFGLGMSKRSPRVTTRLDLTYQTHDLLVDAHLDQGVLAGGLTGWWDLDAWADVETFALRGGRSERRGPWRGDYGFSVMRARFDALMSLNLGAAYCTPEWELSATGSILGGVLDMDFEDLLPPTPGPGPGPGPGPAPPRPPKPSAHLRPGYIFAFSCTRFL
jgi:hypothetical protein